MPTCVIIDDSERIRDLTGQMLSEVGYDVHGAHDPASGLELLQEKKPELILLDWDLPKLGALDVLTGTAEVALPRPITILMAAEYDPTQFSLARAAGASSHVLKPFDRASFFDALRKAGIDVLPGAA
ncbi:MAG: response regulator [Pseudomonadota bacterium]